MGIKPKTSFRHCIPIRCSRWVAPHPTHIPRRPKKKPLRGKKVGFAEKNCACNKKWRIVCIKGSVSLSVSGLPQLTLRGSLLWLRLSPSCARLCLACMSTIRHLRRRFVCDYCGLWVPGGRSWQMGSLRSTFGFAFPARMRNFLPLR